MLTFFVTDPAITCGTSVEFRYKDDAIVEFTNKALSVAIYAKEDNVFIEVHSRDRSYDFGNISGALVYKSDNIGDTIKSLGGEENQANIRIAVIALINSNFPQQKWERSLKTQYFNA